MNETQLSLLKLAQSVGRVEGVVTALGKKMDAQLTEDRDMHKNLEKKLDELAKHVGELDIDAAVRARTWKLALAVSAGVTGLAQAARALGWL